MKISVTNECIANGVREDSNSCAVARAIKGQVPNVVENSVAVDQYEIAFETGDGNYYEFGTPPHVDEFIDQFDCCDRRCDVDPIEFELDLDAGLVDGDDAGHDSFPDLDLLVL